MMDEYTQHGEPAGPENMDGTGSQRAGDDARNDRPRITAITLENFKSIGAPVTIPMRDITLVFGPNSVGKSTIIQALQYMAKVLRGKDLDAPAPTDDSNPNDPGGFSSLVYRKDTSKTMRIGIKIEGKNICHEMSNTLEKNYYNDELMDLTLGFAGDRGLDFGNIKPTQMYICVGISLSQDKKPCIKDYEIECNNISFLKASQLDGDTAVILVNILHPYIELICNNKADGVSYTGSDNAFGEHVNLTEYHCLKYFISAKKETGDILQEEEIDSEKWVEFNICNLENLFIGQEILLKATDELILNIHNEKTQEFKNEIADLLKINVDSIGEKALNKLIDHLNGRGLDMSVLSSKEKDRRDLTISFMTLGGNGLALKVLDEIRYLGPLRKVPSRNFIPSTQQDPKRWFTGMGAWDALLADKEKEDSKAASLVRRCNMHLRQTLGCHYSLSYSRIARMDVSDDIVAELFSAASKGADKVKAVLNGYSHSRVQVKDEAHDITVELEDIGTGMSQLIPVVVGACVEGASLFVVQEPELHEHPKLQANMGDVFLVERKNPVLLETHSEHLILRILRRIRDTHRNKLEAGFPPIIPQDVQVLYMKPGKEGVVVYPLDINELGDFINSWPDGFFTEREEDLF